MMVNVESWIEQCSKYIKRTRINATVKRIYMGFTNYKTDTEQRQNSVDKWTTIYSEYLSEKEH